jgi:RNA polymerase sigma factor (sigma-70 family)
VSEGHQEFHDLMQRLRAGSPEAAETLLDNYHSDVHRVVRHWLHRRLRSQFDSVDFLQSVWGSFFALPAEDLQFADAATLRAFLLDLATNKVISAFRSRMRTQRRDLTREQSLDGSAKVLALGLAADDSTPSQALIAQEAWDDLVEDLPKASKTMLTLMREGHTQREIAEQLSVSERTVARLLHKLRTRRES